MTCGGMREKVREDKTSSAGNAAEFLGIRSSTGHGRDPPTRRTPFGRLSLPTPVSYEEISRAGVSCWRPFGDPGPLLHGFRRNATFARTYLRYVYLERTSLAEERDDRTLVLKPSSSHARVLRSLPSLQEPWSFFLSAIACVRGRGVGFPGHADRAIPSKRAFRDAFERFDVALCTLHVAHGSFGSHLDAPGARRGLPGPSHPRFGAHVARTATVGRSEARHVRTKRRRSVLGCCRKERGRGTRRTRRERCVLHGSTWAKPRGKSDNEPRKNRRRRTCTSGKDLAKRRNVRRCCAEHGTISVRTRPNELGRLRKDGRNTT